MVDCPEKLHSGADLLVSLSIYLLPSAFKRYVPEFPISSTSPSKTYFNEGYETSEEEALRQRTYSLQQMFEKLSLNPRRGHNSLGIGKENVPPDGICEPKSTPNSQATKGVFIDAEDNKVGDPAESENLEEILSETDIDIIYKR